METLKSRRHQGVGDERAGQEEWYIYRPGMSATVTVLVNPERWPQLQGGVFGPVYLIESRCFALALNSFQSCSCHKQKSMIVVCKSTMQPMLVNVLQSSCLPCMSCMLHMSSTGSSGKCLLE